MTYVKQMAQLKRGETGMVWKLDSLWDIRRRLLDMGLVEGTHIECLGKSPLGTPIAFLIRGTVIAIREEDAADILIQCEGKECEQRSGTWKKINRQTFDRSGNEDLQTKKRGSGNCSCRKSKCREKYGF